MTNLSLSVIRMGRFQRGSHWLEIGPKGRRPWLDADTCGKRPSKTYPHTDTDHFIYRVDRGMLQIGRVFICFPRRSGT